MAPRLHPETEDGNAAGGKTHHLLGPWLNVTLNLFGKLGEAQDWDFFLFFYYSAVSEGLEFT